MEWLRMLFIDRDPSAIRVLLVLIAIGAALVIVLGSAGGRAKHDERSWEMYEKAQEAIREGEEKIPDSIPVPKPNPESIEAL